MTTKREYEERFRMFERLRELGITSDHCEQLRRISMTLRRWFELECGNGNDHGSWCITRGRKVAKVFTHDDDGTPFMERHHYAHGHGKDTVTHTALADRENGAKKRLAAIMANYPTLSVYVQTDPRGAALYVLKPGDIPADGTASQYYTRGICVY